MTVIDLTAVFGRLTVHLSAGSFGPTRTDKVQSQSPSAVTLPSLGGARLVTCTCHRPVARDSLGPAKDDQRSGSLTAEMQNYVVNSLDMHQQPCRDTKQLQITQIFRLTELCSHKVQHQCESCLDSSDFTPLYLDTQNGYTEKLIGFGHGAAPGAQIR